MNNIINTLVIMQHIISLHQLNTNIQQSICYRPQQQICYNRVLTQLQE